MPEAPGDAAAVAGEAPALRLRPAERLAMIALGFLPLFQIGATASVIVVGAGRPAAYAAAVIVLYLAPPLGARLCGWLWAVREGYIPTGSRGFLAWWAASQWQTVFNRMPFLEEALRLVPGAYSLWLRLWGARVGRLVYWSPGLRIADRALLEVGDRVVFGAGVRVHGHLLARGTAGETVLIVAPVHIEAEAMVGAYSLLSPGVRIGRGETSPATRTLGPFTEWRQNRRYFEERGVGDAR